MEGDVGVGCGSTFSWIPHGGEEKSRPASRFREVERDISTPGLTQGDGDGTHARGAAAWLPQGRVRRKERRTMQTPWHFGGHQEGRLKWYREKESQKIDAAKFFLKMEFLGRLENAVPTAVAVTIASRRLISEQMLRTHLWCVVSF